MVNIERAILGSFLLIWMQDKEDQDRLSELRLDPDLFMLPFHKHVAKTINFLLDKKEICDDLAAWYYVKKSEYFTEGGWSEIILQTPMPYKIVKTYIELLEKENEKKLLKEAL